MFWDQVAGVYDVFVNVVNGKRIKFCVGLWRTS